jgi:thioredoxin 2
MSNVKASESGVVESCPKCNQKNRIPFDKLGEAAQCGNCHSEIPAVSAPIDVESEAAFDKLIRGASLPVIVDYWAPWCPPCRAVAPEFEKVAKSSTGRYVVAKVDTQSLPMLGARFRIQSIPAMIVFDHGKEVARTVGARPAAAIDAFVSEAIGSPAGARA